MPGNKLTINLAEGLREKLEFEAGFDEVTVTEFIRRAISEHILNRQTEREIETRFPEGAEVFIVTAHLATDEPDGDDGFRLFVPRLPDEEELGVEFGRSRVEEIVFPDFD